MKKIRGKKFQSFQVNLFFISILLNLQYFLLITLIKFEYRLIYHHLIPQSHGKKEKECTVKH